MPIVMHITDNPILMNFADILIAFLIDLAVGDPYWLPHPVRFIGWVIKKCEIALRRMVQKSDAAKRRRNERLAGGVLAFATIAASVLPVYIILKAAGSIHPALFHILNIYFIYSALASKCLATEARKVYAALAAGNIPEARKRLSWLVGRETKHLEKPEIIRGVVETTAENTVDGVLSPMFYAIIGSFLGFGAPLAIMFKAVSTLDSMVGYLNEKYIDFGRISAKLDDAANYIPARLSGLLIPAGAFFCRLDFKKSFSIMKRDRHNHKSPNCAWPEAAFAGALRIRVGGSNVYFGQIVEKPTIGDPDKELDEEDILRANKLMYSTSLIALLLGSGLSVGLYLGLGYIISSGGGLIGH